MLQRWPLTDQARAAVVTGRGVSRARCVPYGPPELHIEAVLTTIEVQAGTVALVTDPAPCPCGATCTSISPHTRRIWLRHLAVIRSVAGSKARSCVDTIGFTAQEEGFSFGVPSSERKHLVERLALSADGRQLLYTTTIVDPDVLTEVVTVEARLDYRPDLTRTIGVAISARRADI